MTEKTPSATPSGEKPGTRRQVSSGGVVFREVGAQLQVAIVRVPPKDRWQLPKGLVDPDEDPATTALREVHEEAGVIGEILAPLDTIEYWYVGYERGKRVRFHKFVHFYLMRYLRGDVADHDHEVHEARWVPAEEALEMLAFQNEQRAVQQGLARWTEIQNS